MGNSKNTNFRALRSFIKRPFETISALRQIDKLSREDIKNPQAPVIANPQLWLERYKQLVLTLVCYEPYPKAKVSALSFYQDPISRLKPFADAPPDDEVILITAVKNDRARIQMFLEHYRKLGVRHFVFIDNGSDDGTVEAILSESDTACYQTNAAFSAAAKAGWFCRIAAYYGENRWYIIVDSDELLVYPRAGKVSIQQYIQAVQAKGHNCVKTIMLDVYPDGLLMDKTKSDEEYMKTCVYYDRGDNAKGQSVYDITSDGAVFGGTRTRLFTGESKVKLTKPTLINYAHAFVISPHKVLPLEAETQSSHGAVVLHYKFLPSDRERYVIIAKEGKYYSVSKIYKAINDKFDKTSQINAMCELSVKFSADDFLSYFPFIKDLTADDITEVN